MSDLINKGKQLFGKSSSSGGDTQAAATNQQGEDYTDKGLDAFERKEGIPQNRALNERVTDGARDGFESETGKNIPSNISN